MEPLEQFHEWYDRYKAQRKGGGLADSEYSLARAAFYAGHEARQRGQLAPSRDVLDQAPRPLARYDRKPVEYPVQSSVPWQQGKDYGYLAAPGSGFSPGKYRTQNFTPDGLPGGAADYEWQGHPTGPQKRITREDTALMSRAPFDQEPYIPDPGDKVVLEHVDTVWDGSDPDETMQFGARGPVRTAIELYEGGNG